MGKRPISLSCRNSDELPPPSRIIRQCKRGRYVVIRIEKAPVDPEKTVASLQQLLPDHEVFFTEDIEGNITLSVYRLLTRTEIDSFLDPIEKASTSYLERCRELQRAWHNEILDSQWEIFEHGEQRRFTHGETGEEIEIPVKKISGIQEIDPAFLLSYIKSVPNYKRLYKRLEGDFNRLSQILDTLKALRK